MNIFLIKKSQINFPNYILFLVRRSMNWTSFRLAVESSCANIGKLRSLVSENLRLLEHNMKLTGWLPTFRRSLMPLYLRAYFCHI